jgi:NADH:ubiquinone oxidoreductase subunit 3 (subunit A)
VTPPPVDPPPVDPPPVTPPVDPPVDPPVNPPVIPRVDPPVTPRVDPPPPPPTIIVSAEEPKAAPPKKEIVDIDEGDAPLSAPDAIPTWALVNLILALVGILLAVVAIIRAQLRKKEKREDEEVVYENENENEEREKKLRVQWLVLTIIASIAGIIVFVLTEDMRNLMIYVDRWTIVNAIILAIVTIGYALAFKTRKDEKDENKLREETTAS